MPSERHITVNGSQVRVWEKGSGKPLALMFGYGGCPRWPEFAERLSKTRHVYLLSLPGQHGSDRGHDLLHTPLDWIVATIEILESGLPSDQPVDLVACSVAGMLGAEVAVFAPKMLRSLTLIDPLGLYDPKNPPHNPYAEASFNRASLLMENTDLYKTAFGPPAGADESQKRDFDILSYRSDESMARLMWPFADIKVARRLHRITSIPVLILWGEKDKVAPPAYATRYTELIPATVRTQTIPGAGHLATFDAPEACATAVLAFVK